MWNCHICNYIFTIKRITLGRIGPKITFKLRQFTFKVTTQLQKSVHKAWLGYCIALSKNEDENALLYASIVQNLQRELGIQVREFAEIDMFGSAIDKEESRLAVIDPLQMKRYKM